jgi:primary-amine oxidase
MVVPHPLDPVTPAELRRAVKILQDYFHGARPRFKFIDIYECPKSDVIPYRARIYFHKNIKGVFQKAIVNLTTGDVELLEDLPDIQGPVRDP